MRCVHRVYEEQQQEQQLMEMRRKNLLDPGPRNFSRLLSFLEVDNNSFLTPWNWKPSGDVPAGEGTSGTKPESSENRDKREEPKKYVSFEPGSFYTHEVSFTVQKDQYNRVLIHQGLVCLPRLSGIGLDSLSSLRLFIKNGVCLIGQIILHMRGLCCPERKSGTNNPGLSL